MLIEKTDLIKSYSKGIKSNFLKIGKILIEIRDKELWNEQYKSFREYLISEDFEFGKSMAYNLIDVYNEFGDNVELINKLGVAKLIELTYVKDKEVREELIGKAENLTRDEVKDEVKKVREEDLFKDIKRKSQREDSDVYIESDDPLLKCKRQAQSILQDIQRLSYPINNMETRLKNWVKFSKKFKEDKQINKLKKAISNEWKKIRQNKTRQDGWFD